VRSPAVPPYGSFYLDGRALGASTTAALAAYREGSFDPHAGIDGFPDHVSQECAFMQRLAQAEGNAWLGRESTQAVLWQRRQQDFLSAHLARWLPAFAERVRAAAGHSFYCELATFAATFAGSDLALLSVSGGFVVPRSDSV